MVTGGVYKVVHKKGTILGKDIFPLPEAPFVSKLKLGWYNVAATSYMYSERVARLKRR